MTKKTPQADERKWIKENLPTSIYNKAGNELLLSLDSFRYLEGPIESAINILKKIKAHYEKKGFRDLKIYNMWSSDEESPSLSGLHLETEEEYEKRIERNKKAKVSNAKAAKKRAETRKKKDLAEFERLTKKFGTRRKT